MIWRRRTAITPSKWDLLSLTPEYLDKEHGVYVSAIENALENKQILNIALSGNYGVGKSSILREVARRQSGRSIELSLSTLAPIKDSEIDDSVPVQAKTSTNRIQQEIVKQLLYRQTPSKAQGSRFRRIERFRWWRELINAMLIGLVIATTFLLAGWSSKISSEFLPLLEIGLWVHPGVWAISTTVVLLLRHLLYGQFHIKQLSAGSATVTLDDTSVSYFDQYLDEIVYFFENSDLDIVIFEDIDRFNDSHIFETLRALNALLNVSPQVDRPVRFIYAIKDSIFDQFGLEHEGRQFDSFMLEIKDPAQAEAVRANRTKFFDLVIPVVPFITHRSARNLVTQLLAKFEHKIDSELLDLAAQYVPDMRLLKNVRNEFIIFRDRIYSGDGKRLRLGETKLFAMMLYKSTHLADFEAIRIGKSKLDTLYTISRGLVSENIKRIEREQREARYLLVRLNSIASRSEQLGNILLSHVSRTLQTVGYREQNPVYSFSGNSYKRTDLTGEKFWENFVSADENSILEWQDQYYGQRLTFSRENLLPVFDDPLDAKSWNKADRDALTEKIVQQNGYLKFLRSADMGDLMKRNEFLVSYKDKEQPFETIVQTLLSKGLAYQLIRAGYIDRNFTLYTSTFHGDRVSPAATNFVIHHVERDLMDPHYQLDSKDVDTIIRERGKNSLGDPALYNISILDYLLREEVTLADIMISALARFGDRQTEFIQAYLDGGSERSRFIERLTKVSTRVLLYLISEAEIDDELRLDLVSSALSQLDDTSNYKTDSSVSTFLENNYASLAMLTTGEITPSQADRIAALFGRSNIILPSLKPLADTIRQSFVSLNLFEINQENLSLAIGPGASLSLDSIQNHSESLYEYVLKSLDEYLNAIDGISHSVESSEKFIPIIEDVLARESERLREIVMVASATCRVLNIKKVSPALLPALAKLERFPATFSNIHHYIEVIGAIDDNLATLLASAGTIEDPHKFDEATNRNLAIMILSAINFLPSPRLRATLVASLALDSELSINSIAAEDGELFSLLLKQGIIADEVTTYEHLKQTTWATREAFIEASATFVDYMTPAHIQGNLASLMKSDRVEQAVKYAIVDRAGEFTERASRSDLVELALFALRNSRELPLPVVHRLAQAGVPATLVIPHLEPHLLDVESQVLLTILASLEDDYPRITTVGKDQPKVLDTPSNRVLLERLKKENIVSSYKPSGANLRVHKRQ